MGAGITLVVIGLVAGYLLRYRSVEAVEQLVNNLSGGEYTFTATSFKFNLFKFQINAKNVEVVPTTKNNDNTQFLFRADSLSINVNNPIQLLFFKRLSVNKLIIKTPYLELKTLQKDSLRNKLMRPLRVEIAAVQDVFFNVLSSLEVQHFKLTDGSVSIYPDFNQHQRRFFLNHIFLSLDDLHLLRKIKQWDNTNRVAVDFRLLKPIIEYPDSSLQVVLDKLVWQSRQRRFELSGLDFHKRMENNQEKSGFRLENIQLDSLNWNKLLTEGRIELGLLKAGKGFFTSNNIRFRRSSDKKTVRVENSFLDVLGPINIKQVEIDSIEFSGTTYGRRGKETLQLFGDNFLVTNLVVDNALPNKIELDDLEFAVRGFLESDSNKSFQTGFDGMRIKKNQLILQNYFLRTANRSNTGNNSIQTRQLILNNLSIPELLNGRLQANELFLIEPNVRIHLGGNKQPKKTNPIREIQRTIRRKLQIETIRILDADLLITAEKRKDPLVQSTSFSAIISSNSVLRAGTLEQLFDGKNKLEMPQLALRFNNLKIDLKDAVYENNSLTAINAKGYSSDQLVRFNLNRVHVKDINAAGIITGKDTNWVREIVLGSGDLTIRSNGSKKNNHPSARLPKHIIRNIRTGKIDLMLEQPGLQVNSRIDSLSVDSLQYENNQWKWHSYYLAGRKLTLEAPRLQVSTAQFRISSLGGSTFKQLQVEAETDKLSISANIPGLQSEGSPASLKDPLTAIRKAVLNNPTIRLVLKEQKEFKEASRPDKPIRQLPAIELTEPTVDIRRTSNDSTFQLFSSSGGFFKTAPISLNNGQLKTDQISFSLYDIIAIPDKTSLQLGSFSLAAGNFVLDKSLTAKIGLIAVNKGLLNHQTDNYKLGVKDIRISNRAPIDFSSEKEDLKNFLKNLPHINVAAEEVRLENSRHTWLLLHPQVNADQKILGFDSIRFSNLLSKDSFFKQSEYQTDFIEFTAGKSRILGYERTFPGSDTLWKANRIEFDQFHLMVDRDKRLPVDTVSYRPLLTDLIKNIPLNIELGAALLTNSRIQYNETSSKTGKEGRVWFSNLNMVAGPIKNYDLQQKDSFNVSITCDFMDQGKLKFAFRQSYTDSLKGFLLLARMGTMRLDALSPLLRPLFNLHIRDGRTDSLWLRVKGNDYFAYGHMELDYHKLRFELLKEDGKKKKFASFLANLLIKNKNAKKGLVYQERIRNKSTFNFWGKIALSGLMNNMGIKRDKKYLRTYKKEAARLAIPEELLQ